jgi:hypothetical protein
VVAGVAVRPSGPTRNGKARWRFMKEKAEGLKG